MSHWIGTTSPSDAGMNDFKECLKNLRDGQSEEALQHARRALGIAPKNPFYLSYTGSARGARRKKIWRCGIALPRSAGNETQSRPALSESGGSLLPGWTHFGSDHHARTRAGLRRTRFPHPSRPRKNRRAPRSGAHLLASQPSGESHPRQIAPPADRTRQSSLTKSSRAQCGTGSLAGLPVPSPFLQLSLV